MIQVIHGGEAEAAGLMYGTKHPGTLQFLRNQISNVTETLTEAGRAFFSNVGDMFERFNGSEAMRRTKAAMAKVSNAFALDEIRWLPRLEDVQQALPKMQRVIMACPEVRQMWFDQRIDGYSNSYVNMFANDIGDQHYDYRRVMDGIWHEDANGEEKMTMFFDQEDEDQRLEVEDVDNILSVWDICRLHLKAGKGDPTNSWGGLM